jgi:hypothetical protein
MDHTRCPFGNGAERGEPAGGKTVLIALGIESRSSFHTDYRSFGRNVARYRRDREGLMPHPESLDCILVGREATRRHFMPAAPDADSIVLDTLGKFA